MSIYEYLVSEKKMSLASSDPYLAIKKNKQTKTKNKNKKKQEDHWFCIAHLIAEDILKSAVIEENSLNIALGQGQTNH